MYYLLIFLLFWRISGSQLWARKKCSFNCPSTYKINWRKKPPSAGQIVNYLMIYFCRFFRDLRFSGRSRQQKEKCSFNCPTEYRRSRPLPWNWHRWWELPFSFRRRRCPLVLLRLCFSRLLTVRTVETWIIITKFYNLITYYATGCFNSICYTLNAY